MEEQLGGFMNENSYGLVKMMRNRRLSLCFDLDGTLIDTAPDLVRVLNLVIAKEGLGATDYNAARDHVGFGAKKLIREACARADHAISEARVDELWHLFLKLYEDDIAQLSRPFPGVLETLKKLRQGGHELSVCTNKPGFLARKLINSLKMENLFVRIVGSRDGVPTKPSPSHIFAAVGHRDPNRIVMVGDSLPDVAAARAAGVPSILMRYGYAGTPADRLRADITLRQFRELPGSLFSLSRPSGPY